MITIRIIDRRGQPVSGVRVHIAWDYTFNEGYTNFLGIVQFNNSGGTGNLYIDGNPKGSQRFSTYGVNEFYE